MNPINDLHSLKSVLQTQNDFDELVHIIDPSYPEDEFHHRELKTDFKGFAIDEVTTKILSPSCRESLIPLFSKPDGNCLFNSVSILFCGTEALSSHLRMQTFLELYNNNEYYARHPFIENYHIENCSDMTYETLFGTLCYHDQTYSILQSEGFGAALRKEIRETVILGHDACLLHILALSSVIGRPITSVYPDNSYKFSDAYNCSISSRILRSNVASITLCWTNTLEWFDRTSRFLPNHFVPLVPASLCRPALQKPFHQTQMSSKQSKPNQTNSIQSFFNKRKTDKTPIVIVDEQQSIKESVLTSHRAEVSPVIPLAMPLDWYKQLGRTVIGNAARDEQRQQRRHSGNDEILRGTVKGSLREAVDRIDLQLKSATSLHRRKLEASRRVALFLIDQKPLAETKEIGKIYQGDEVRHFYIYKLFLF